MEKYIIYICTIQQQRLIKTLEPLEHIFLIMDIIIFSSLVIL